MAQVLGIDVGGTGIKAGIVDTTSGMLSSDRIRLETPPLAKPNQIAQTITELIQKLSYKGVVGIGFPAVIRRHIVETASNVDKSWIGINLKTYLQDQTNYDCYCLNDADAAGMAEIAYNSQLTQHKKVLVLTIGTGIGSALFNDGMLIPNTEFGHLLKEEDLIWEKYVSNKLRKTKAITTDEWAKRINEYLLHIDFVLRPDLIVIGGGGSKKFEQLIQPALTVASEVVPAIKLNNAGIIGAAIYATKEQS